MMAVSIVIRVICDHLGCMDYDDLVQIIAGEDLEDVLNNNRNLFTVIQQNKAKKVLGTARVRRCRAPECLESCTDVHLCKYDLLGQCNTQRCKYGHSLESEHNSRVLRAHSLHDLSKDQLRVLLLQNDGSLLPNVCVSYNKGSGEFGNCPDKEACTRLHVCERYLRGLCDGGSECNRCHDFYEPHPMKTLQARGVASQLIGPLLLIYRNILTLKDHRNARIKPGARGRENPKPSNSTKVPESLQRNAEKVICLSFIRGNCKYGEKCWRVHFGAPYKWEVEVDDVWIDIPDNEVIERDYSDPAKIHSEGSEPVRYDTMMQGLHRVRRLSTVSSVVEPSFSHTTKWIWSWKNEYNTWIEYGSVKEMHRLTSITSDELERKYLQFLEDNTRDVVKFAAGKQFYELNFRDMKQRNEWSSTERTVRRRPFFVSLFDVRRASRRGPTSRTPRLLTGHAGVPGFWDKTAIPESGFQRVLLDPSHKDYVRVQEHFNKTMQGFQILTTERVQNRELWEDFQTKRERMKKANSDKKYKEAERLLFHGTNAKNVDAICRQNFDMRVSGTNATVYGQGSYFARDAKYSNDYADHDGERCMFACRVLVGQYTKGLSHYRRPPAKDEAGNLYDSCVNDLREPTIYVVFERSQVYPEFLITYEKSRVPNDINTLQFTNRTASGFDDSLDVSQTSSVSGTSSPHKANNGVTSGLTTTGETFAASSIPTTRNPFYAASDSSVNPAKDGSLGSQPDDTKSLNVVLPKSEPSIHSTPPQDLTSPSRLLKESDQGLCTSPVFSNSPNLLIDAKRNLSNNTTPSGIAQNQQTLTACTSNLANERRFVSDTQSSPPLRSPEIAKQVTDSLDPFSSSSDKALIFDASPTTCLSEQNHKQSISEGYSSGSRCSENAGQSFDGVFNVSQTASVMSTSSPHKAYITTCGSTRKGEEALASKPAQGLTSLSYTGLPKKSAQDLLVSAQIHVSSHSDSQLSSWSKPSLPDRSIPSKLRPNTDLITTQRSQSSEQDSQKPAVRRELGTAEDFLHPLATPSSTARARNLHSDASSASSHLAEKRDVSVMYKTSSSSTDMQSRSAGSLSSSSVSFYEMQQSALPSKQTPPKSTNLQQASHQKYGSEAQSKQEKCIVQ